MKQPSQSIHQIATTSISNAEFQDFLGLSRRMEITKKRTATATEPSTM